MGKKGKDASGKRETNSFSVPRGFFIFDRFFSFFFRVFARPAGAPAGHGGGGNRVGGEISGRWGGPLSKRFKGRNFWGLGGGGVSFGGNNPVPQPPAGNPAVNFRGLVPSRGAKKKKFSSGRASVFGNPPGVNPGGGGGGGAFAFPAQPPG